MSLLFTPVFYVVMQRLGELRDKKKDPPPEKTAA
jgi:hypothetical protein